MPPQLCCCCFFFLTEHLKFFVVICSAPLGWKAVASPDLRKHPLTLWCFNAFFYNNKWRLVAETIGAWYWVPLRLFNHLKESIYTYMYTPGWNVGHTCSNYLTYFPWGPYNLLVITTVGAVGLMRAGTVDWGWRHQESGFSLSLEVPSSNKLVRSSLQSSHKSSPTGDWTFEIESQPNYQYSYFVDNVRHS